jgi:haloacid dehalogenase superfamily, subfamily IA, variant 1 with third motif having Dx(3-4)D or Dx(3-4)E
MSKTTRYQALIVDLDGTLYFQTPVRLFMALSILIFCVIHPFRWREVFLIRYYRKLYTKGIDHSKRCAQIAQQYAVQENLVEQMVEDWMIQRPLSFVRAFRDKRLLSLLSDCQKAGNKIIIYSDYPVTEKLKVLDFKPDAAYAADDVGCLKPMPDGLLHILDEQNLVISECLFIGDKKEKDGKCAENVGMENVILPQSRLLRGRKLIEMLGM